MDTDLQRFAHSQYVIREKFFKIFGESFHVFDPEGNVVLYSKMKALRLKEDIRLYESEAMQRELLRIAARSIIDFGATYDVFDSVTNEKVGSLRRKGLKSLIRDTWLVFDEGDREVGVIEEDSTFKAVVRRIAGDWAWLFPQAFRVRLGETAVMHVRQRFNPIVKRLEIDFSPDPQAALDRRLGLAIGILMSAIEGRQG